MTKNAHLSSIITYYYHKPIQDRVVVFGIQREPGLIMSSIASDSVVPRSNIFLTTKLQNAWHHHVPEGIDTSLKDLGFDYVALYLIHESNFSSIRACSISISFRIESNFSSIRACSISTSLRISCRSSFFNCSSRDDDGPSPPASPSRASALSLDSARDAVKAVRRGDKGL